MTTTSLDAYWNKPAKIEGSLGDDGDYPVIFSDATTRFVKEGTTALVEFPFSVTEGDSAGEKGKVSIFYITDDEMNHGGMDRLKAVSDFVDPNLREEMKFNESLEALKTLIAGRTGTVNQNTWKGRVYHTITAVNPPAEPVPTQKPKAKATELETDDNIPF